MRNAPSVTYPVGRCAVQGGVLILLSGLAVLALVLLAVVWPSASALWFWGGACVWMGWTAWALRAWWLSPVGRLHWDAQAAASTALPGDRPGGWRWHGDGPSLTDLNRVEWVLDAQTTLLLRIYPHTERARWLWLEARSDPRHWDDMRRALTNHARRG